MAQCKATKADGFQCLNFARAGSAFCQKHADRLDIPKIIGAGIGIVAGNALLPGLGPKIIGAMAGHVVTGLLRDVFQVKKRAFISFDFDYDRGLKELFVGQARMEDTPFDIIDHSLKEAAPERNWEAKARTAIRRSDILLVLLGQFTYRAPGVLREVAMARAEGKQIFQVIGYRDRTCPSVPGGGRRFDWNWPTLNKLLS